MRTRRRDIRQPRLVDKIQSPQVAQGVCEAFWLPSCTCKVRGRIRVNLRLVKTRNLVEWETQLRIVRNEVVAYLEYELSPRPNVVKFS